MALVTRKPEPTQATDKPCVAPIQASFASVGIKNGAHSAAVQPPLAGASKSELLEPRT
jgi:hypothetical protein